jgi:uncharacterized protein (TIGR03435 family)
LCFNVALLAKLWFTGLPRLVVRSLEISDLAAPPPELGRPVIDETRLDGQYDFKLQWDPTDSASTATPDATSNRLAGLSIVTALREQLGLRLIAKKGPVQVFVIERIERPSEN